MTDKPKCLVLDIETYGLVASLWQTGEQYVHHKQVKKDFSIAAWGAKWLNAPVSQAFYADQRNAKNQRDDKKILLKLRDLLDQADFVMTQNGIKFDWPKIRARLMLNRIEPPSYFQHIDLYREYKSVGFTSHSLEYLTDNFCVKYKKLHHEDYPGNTLWDECEKGNQKAWAAMKKYNLWDIFSLEEAFQNTCQWLPRVTYKLSVPVHNCVKCGGRTFASNGSRTGVRNGYIRKYCRQCGELFKETKAVIG